MTITFNKFSHKVSNSIDSNNFKHITAKQVDTMIESIKPKFNLDHKSNKFENTTSLHEQIFVDDFGFMHGPYESDNLVVNSSGSDIIFEEDDYNDITGLYTENDPSSISSVSTNQAERISQFSKDLVPLKYDTNKSKSKVYERKKAEESFFKADVELHKCETLLEKDFLTRFNEKMYMDDVLLGNIDLNLNSNVFIKFEYLKNIMEWNDTHIKGKDINIHDISVHFKDNTTLQFDEFENNTQLVPVKDFKTFLDERLKATGSGRKESPAGTNRAFVLKQSPSEEDKSDPDDYIINNESISSGAYSITRRSPSRKYMNINKHMHSIKRLEKQTHEHKLNEKLSVKRVISTSDKSSGGKSEKSAILRQRSLKRAIEANSKKGSSKKSAKEYVKNYENLKSDVSLLDLYANDDDEDEVVVSSKHSTGPGSPRLLPVNDEYNPVFSTPSQGLDLNNGISSHDTTFGTETQSTDSSILSSSPNTSTERSSPLNTSSGSPLKVSKTGSFKSLSLKKWKSTSKGSNEYLNVDEPPVLSAKSKSKKKTDKPLIKQITEKLVKNKKDTEIKEDPLKPILPSELQKNELEKEFRFPTDKNTTTDADDEYNTGSSDMKENYGPPVHNDTSSYYGTQSTVPSSLNTDVSRSTQQDLENHKHAKENTIEKINKIGIIPEIPQRGRSRSPRTSGEGRGRTYRSVEKPKKPDVHFNDPYLNMLYDESGHRRSSEDPFQR